MIDVETMVAAADSPEIRALDFSAFDEGDVINLIAQRSEIIFDTPDPDGAMKRWAAGREEDLRDLAQAQGDQLMRRAAGIIHREYQQIKPQIDALAPKSVADIGCGYAFFDLFLWRDHPGRIVLIDLEETDSRHFGYKGTGAAYSNLDRAKAFLVANGVAPRQVWLVNPDKKALPKSRVDLAVSFISCGFHYPVETYATYFRDGVRAGGGIILDVRRRRVTEALSVLEPLGAVTELTAAARGKAARLMVARAA